jgi:hypothetical protein
VSRRGFEVVQQLVSSVDQIGGIGNELPIIFPSVPEAETPYPFLARAPPLIPNFGQQPPTDPLETRLGDLRLAVNAG